MEQHPLVDRLVTALRGIHERGSRPKPFPSPSVVGRGCRRQLWYMGRRVPITNPTDSSSVLSMELGKAQELLMADVLEEAGVVGASKIPLIHAVRLGLATGEADYVGQDTDGIWRVYEFKRMGMWRYLSFVRKGLATEFPDYYAQAALYARALEVGETIVVGVPADYSAIIWATNKGIVKGALPPIVWAESVPASAVDELMLIERVRKLSALTAFAGPPSHVPRDFTPGRDRFPCDYCNWRFNCEDAGEYLGNTSQ